MGFKRLKKIIAIVLSMALTVTVIPDNIKAAVLSQNTTSTTSQADAALTEEIADMRKANVRFYQNSDGSQTAVVYNTKVNYLDGQSYKQVDNSLIDVTDSNASQFRYKNAANNFNVYFAESIKSPEVVELDYDNYKIGFKPVNIETDQAFSGKVINNTINYNNAKITVNGLNGPKVIDYSKYLSYKDNYIQYDNVYGTDTSLRYKVFDTGFKEEIVLKSYTSQNIFEFNVNVKGCRLEKLNNGKIAAKDINTDEIKGGIPLPYMYDSSVNDVHYSENIQTELKTIDENQGLYKITYIIDNDFLKRNDLTYPVIIDPSFYINGAANTKDTYVQSSNPGSNYYLSDELRVGYNKSTGNVLSYIKYPDLPKLDNVTVTGAYYVAYNTNYSASSGDSAPIELHSVNSGWDSSGITWNNAPGYGRTEDCTQVIGAGPYAWDITNLANSWYHNNTNYGFVLKEADGHRHFTKFASSDSQAAPVLIINYLNPVTTLKVDCHSEGVNSGSGYVNLNWNRVPGAKGYRVAIFNGDSYNYIDVGDTTEWTSKDKKIWPTTGEIENGRIDIHVKDKLGVELPDDPYFCYSKAYNIALASGKTGVRDYGSTHNYFFRVQPYDDYNFADLSSCNCVQDVFIPDSTTPDNVQNINVNIPNAPPANTANSWKVDASWNAVKDNPSGNASGIQKYNVVLEEVPVTAASYEAAKEVNSGTQVSFLNVPDNKTYHVAVYTYDNKGNYTKNPTISDTFSTGDRTPPSKASKLVLQSDCITNTLNISWEGITDTKLSSIQYCFDDSGWTDIGSSSSQGNSAIDCTDLSEGQHTISIRGIDDSQNIGEPLNAIFTKDITPPDANFSSIIDGQSLAGTILINGTAYDKNIEYWTLDYAYGKNPDYGSYKNVLQRTDNVQNGLIATWNIENYMAGFYSLRLTIYDKAGNSREKTVVFQKNHKVQLAPEINIYSPKNSTPVKNISTQVLYGFNNGSGYNNYNAKLFINSKKYTEAIDGKLNINALDFKEGSCNEFYVEASDFQGNKFTSANSYCKQDILKLNDITWEKTDNLQMSPYITLLDSNAGCGTAISKEIKCNDPIRFLKIDSNYYSPEETSISWEVSCDGGSTWKLIPYDKQNFELPSGTYSIKFRIKLLLLDEFKDYYKNAQKRNPDDYTDFYPVITNADINIGTTYSKEVLFYDEFLQYTHDPDPDDFSKFMYKTSPNIDQYNNIELHIGALLAQYNVNNNDNGGTRPPIHTDSNIIRPPFKPEPVIKTKYYYTDGSLITNRTELNEIVSDVELDADYEEDDGTSIKFYISSDNQTTWQEVKPNEPVKLDKPGSNIIVKAVFHTDSKTVSPVLHSWKLTELVSDTPCWTNNSFTVQLMDIPEKLTATPKVNYTVLLRWNYDQTQVATETTFNIYRSTDPNFIPAAGNLIAKDVKTTYWNDYNLNYGRTFYYKVTAVRDFPGQKGRESICSEGAKATVVEQDEVNKRLGIEDYWGAADFNMGKGQGYINVSSGNLCYQITDFVYPSPILAEVMRRSYNAQAGACSPLGYGWDFSFNTNLLCEYDASGNIVTGMILKDGDGTTHRFIKKADGNFLSPKGSHMELEQESDGGYRIKRDDNITYLFDKSMNLCAFTDLNGNRISIFYNYRGNICRVSDKYGHDIIFNYDDNPDTDRISSITDPAGREFHYTYNSDGMLESMYLITEKNVKYAETYFYDNEELSRIIDPEQHPTKLDYYSNETIKRITDAKEDYTDVKYTSAARTEFTSNRGVHNTFDYNSDGSVTRYEDTLNHVKTMIYDENCNVLTESYKNIIDGALKDINYSYTYDNKGNILTITDPMQNVETFSYNDLNECKGISKPVSKDKDGNTIYAITLNTYDSNGNHISTKDSEGRTTTYEYFDNGLMKDSIDCFGNKTEYQYKADGSGMLWKKIEPLNKVTEYVSYDKQGNPKEVKDANGKVTTYTYDILGRKTEVLYPDNHKESFQYDLNDNLKVSTDGKGYDTIYGYDEFNRNIQIQTPDKKISSISYDYDEDNNLVVTTQDGENRISKKFYDKAGRVVKESAGENYTKYEYDMVGNAVKIIGRDDYIPDKEVVLGIAEYDVLNRMKGQVIDPDGKKLQSSYVYDFAGNKISETDGEGNSTSYAYDTLGRLLETHNYVTTRTFTPDTKNISEQKQDYVTRCSYDMKDGDTVYNTSADALGRVTVTYFNALGRKVKEVKGTGDSKRVSSFEYDPNGNLEIETKPDGTIIKNEYNDNNQLKTTWYGTDGTEYTTYEYDANGNRTKMIDKRGNIPAVETSYEYDAVNNIKQITQNNQPTNYLYDGSGNLTDVSYCCNGEGRAIHYYYDAIGRVQYTTLNDKVVSSYTYTLAGKIDSINNYRKFDTDNRATQEVISSPQNYTKVKYSYDTAGMVNSLSYYENGSALKENYILQNDNNGRIKNEACTSNYVNADYTDTDYDSKDSNKEIDITRNDSYVYDEIGRLINEKSSKTETGKTDETLNTDYTYDKVGNRLSKSNEKDIYIYDYDEFNSLKNITKNGKPKSQFKYDVNGNQTQEITQREKDEEPGKDAATITKNFNYDRSDRLFTFEQSDGKNKQTETNYYNGDGQRVKRFEGSDLTGTETDFFYVKNNLLYTMNGNHQIVEDNILDPAGQIIFSGRNDGDYKNKYFLYNYDIRNSVTNIINPEGKLIKGYSYDEFGDTAERGDKTFKNSVKFTGAVSDDSTGLYYMNSRFYNPSTARFLTQDTYTGTPYEPWTQHLYTYCSNDPVDMVDPTGHIPTHPVAMSEDNAIYYPSLAQSSEQRKKQYLSDAIPFIPGINIVNNAKIAITGLDLMNYAYNNNEMQDAQLFMYLDIAAPVIGLECSELNGAGINELKNIDKDELLVTKGAGKAGGKGFDSFSALKRFLGSPGKGNQWHHIVEQNQITRSGFTSKMINNTENIISINAKIHQQISGFYSSKTAFSQGMSVRGWLAGQSFEKQYEFGIKVLKDFGVI